MALHLKQVTFLPCGGSPELIASENGYYLAGARFVRGKAIAGASALATAVIAVLRAHPKGILP